MRCVIPGIMQDIRSAHSSLAAQRAEFDTLQDKSLYSLLATTQFFRLENYVCRF